MDQKLYKFKSRGCLARKAIEADLGGLQLTHSRIERHGPRLRNVEITVSERVQTGGAVGEIPAVNTAFLVEVSCLLQKENISFLLGGNAAEELLLRCLGTVDDIQGLIGESGLFALIYI